MGLTAASLVAELAKVVSREKLEQLERTGDSDPISFEERKAIWGRLLPKEARERLRKARTEEDVEQLMDEYFPTLTEGDQPVHFAVDETFKGEHLANREVWTGQGLGDCGFGFERDRRYLVYASWNKESGRFETSICSRTRKFQEASEEVGFLRAARNGTAQPSVFGSVTTDVEESRALHLIAPRHTLGGVRLTLQTETGNKETETDASGRFAFERLPVGRFMLTATLPGYRFPGFPKAIQLKAAECSRVGVFAERTGLSNK